MDSDTAVLDQRPVKPRSKKTAKRKVKRATKAEKELQLKVEALELEKQRLTAPGRVPNAEPIEQDKPSSGAVTFFSKYKSDVIQVEASQRIEVAPHKYVTIGAKTANFSQHKFTTEDPDVIDYLRNPNNVFEKYEGYGRDLLEIGKPEHEERIHRFTDAGISEYNMGLQVKGQRMLKAEGFDPLAAD